MSDIKTGHFCIVIFSYFTRLENIPHKPKLSVKKKCPFLSHLDGGEVHGVFDDVVVVVQSQSLHIHRFVERPCVRGMLLSEHLLHDAGAVAQLL